MRATIFSATLRKYENNTPPTSHGRIFRQRHCLHNMKLLKPVNELEKIFIEDVCSSSTIVTHTRCHSFCFFFKVTIQFSHPIILSKEPLFFKGIMSIFSCNRKVTAKIPIIVMQSNPVMFRGADNPKKKACLLRKPQLNAFRFSPAAKLMLNLGQEIAKSRIHYSKCSR